MEVLLLDIFREKEAHRVYAITDDQSNASIISTEIADGLNFFGPEWNKFSQPMDATRISNGEE